jgi:hypothetical protein
LIIYPTPSLLIELTGGVFFYEKINYLHHPLFSNKAGRGVFSFYERIDDLSHPLFSNKADRGVFFSTRELII